MKRIFAIILSAAMIAIVLLAAGCGGTSVDNTTPKATDPAVTTGGNDGPDATTGGNPSDETTAGGVEDTTTESTGPVTPVIDGLGKLPGYEDIDFRGAKIIIAAHNGANDGWGCDAEVYSEETDNVSVAVRQRNTIMEKLYNCKIELHSVEEPALIAIADVAGNTHSMDIFTCKYNHGSGTNRYNLMTLGIDFTNEWWDQQWLNTYAVRDSNGVMKMYDVIGDFALSAFSATFVLIYNRTVYESSGIEDNIYDLVREKKWTMDKFAEMIKKGAKENSGNSKFMYEEGDILGWVRTDFAAHALHAASNMSIISCKDGIRSFAMSDFSAAWNDTIDKAIEIWQLPEAQSLNYIKARAACADNSMLFYSEVLGALKAVKDSDLSLGLVPYPLYSESQENYAHFVDDHGMRYAIPLSVPDPEILGTFLELFAYHSRYLVRPAWVDTYSYEYCNDLDSGEMLNIILDTRTYDPAYLSYRLEGEVSSMITTGKNQVTKWIDRNASTAANKITETVNYLATEN